MKWSQTWDVACPRRPTISLHPAADWLFNGKYQLSSWPFFALDDDFDTQSRCHRSWCKTAQPSRDHIMPRLREDPLSKIQVPPAILLPLLQWPFDLSSTYALCYFEHSKSYFWTLRKTPYLFRLWRVLATKKKVPYCFSYSLRPTIIFAFKEANYHPATVPMRENISFP